VTDQLPRVVPDLPRPPYLEAYRDPAFQSRVMRISDTPRGEIIKTLYSTVQAWNADESRLILYHSGGADAGHHLYDGRSYEHLMALPFLPSDVEDLFWDPKRADTLYFVQRRPYGDRFHGKLVAYDIDTGDKRLVADVSRACGTDNTGVVARAGADVHGISGDYIGLRCDRRAATGGVDDLTFAVNLRTGDIGPRLAIGPGHAIGGGTDGSLPDIALAALPSDERFLLQGSVYDRNLRFQHRIDRPLRRDASSRRVPLVEHDSVGRLNDGHDALFTVQFEPGPAGCGVGTLVAHDLQDRDCDVLLGPDTGWGYPLSGIHHSALTTADEGWIASSIIGYRHLEYLTNGRPAPTLFSEIVLTSNDPDNPRTCRLAHARSHGKRARRTARQAYFGEPHPVISPSGTRVLFSSDWYDSGTVDTFVIDVTAVDGSIATPRPPPSLSTRVATPDASPVTDSAEATREDDVPAGVALSLDRLRYATDVERIGVSFTDPTAGLIDRVTIAPAGSPDAQVSMWLYTNGTQRQTLAGPDQGRLTFLRRYLGRGDFEARLFRKDSAEIVARQRFSIGN